MKNNKLTLRFLCVKLRNKLKFNLNDELFKMKFSTIRFFNFFSMKTFLLTTIIKFVVLSVYRLQKQIDILT